MIYDLRTENETGDCQGAYLAELSKLLGGLLSFTVFSSFSSSSKALVLVATGEGSKGLSLIICLTTYL